MSAFVSELTRLRDQYAGEEQELKARIARDQERFSEVQALRAACEVLIKAQDVIPRIEEAESPQWGEEASIRELVLEILTAKRGLGYTPDDIFEILREKRPDITLTQIQNLLRKLIDEDGPIKYGEGHYYS